MSVSCLFCRFAAHFLSFCNGFCIVSKPTDITDEFFAPDEEQNEATNHKSV